MLLALEFDVDADIINVPEDVIVHKDTYRKRFLKWLYSTNNKYKVRTTDSNGKVFCGICFRSDAFVEWLNKTIIKDTNEKAEIVICHTNNYPDNIPRIFF